VSLPSKTAVFEILREIFKIFLSFCQDEWVHGSCTPTAQPVLTTEGPP
jgi:hypothetical protein